MKHILFICMACVSMQIQAQESIKILNFLQAGAVPDAINKGGKSINTSGLSFNLVSFGEDRFFRMDATWLFRYIMNGEKDDKVFGDTMNVLGMDLPVFTATYGMNIIKGDDFSLGLGVNLDSRTFYSSPQVKAKGIIDAFNVGFVTGIKIKLKDWLTYTTLAGYDYMIVDAVKSNNNADGTQIYLQNNFSFLLKGKIGINLQPDFSFKSFDSNGIHGGKIFNKNIKLGICYAIQ